MPAFSSGSESHLVDVLSFVWSSYFDLIAFNVQSLSLDFCHSEYNVSWNLPWRLYFSGTLQAFSSWYSNSGKFTYMIYLIVIFSLNLPVYSSGTMKNLVLFLLNSSYSSLVCCFFSDFFSHNFCCFPAVFSFSS